ncbi:MAG: nucleotidyltransferase [Firmicutes bacterium]|jgi:dTDP-glucose pyrophosphorylase|nr:nucleotidyltransferase [Bacillota bacterium]
MNKPILVIMAAGMGSRFGGLKQIEPVSDKGDIILDFSLYDARLAGFEKAIFIIKKENEQDFRNLIDNKAGKYMEVEYVYQELNDLPSGYLMPTNREKPWGTAHAVLSARNAANNSPIAVINADDYYGPEAFKNIYDFLLSAVDNEKYQYCMVGYQIENTLTENGHVSRGVCQTSEDGKLTKITERTKIQWKGKKIVYTENDGNTWEELPPGTIVSMNFWGFTPSMMKEMEARFPAFLDNALSENPTKGEFFLPGVVDELIQEDKAEVKVLKSTDRWYGVTYKEDKESVVSAIKSMKENGLYPEILWK